MHKVVQSQIEAYLDGTLLPLERREVESHLRGCAECRREMEAVEQTRGWLRLLVLEEPQAPAPGFYARVRQRVESEEARRAWPFWQLFPGPTVTRQLAYALIMLLVLLGSYVFTLEQTEPVPAVEVMLDAPVIRAETPPLTSDTQANRERVMRAIVLPLGSTAGD